MKQKHRQHVGRCRVLKICAENTQTHILNNNDISVKL